MNIWIGNKPLNFTDWKNYMLKDFPDMTELKENYIHYTHAFYDKADVYDKSKNECTCKYCLMIKAA